MLTLSQVPVLTLYLGCIFLRAGNVEAMKLPCTKRHQIITVVTGNKLPEKQKQKNVTL